MNVRLMMPYGFLIAGCASIIGILWFCLARLFLVHTIYYSADQLFSSRAHEEIMAYCDTHFKNSYAYQVLKKPHALIGVRSVAARYYAPGRLAITYKAMAPLCYVGASNVMLANGEIVASRIFSKGVLCDLPRIECAQMQEGLRYQELARIFQQLPDDLFTRYAITLADEHDIQLRDNEQKNFIIRADIASLKTKLLQEAESLKHELIAKKSFTKKGSWIADIRFKNQVIIRNIKSEGGAL